MRVIAKVPKKVKVKQIEEIKAPEKVKVKQIGVEAKVKEVVGEAIVKVRETGKEVNHQPLVEKEFRAEITGKIST